MIEISLHLKWKESSFKIQDKNEQKYQLAMLVQLATSDLLFSNFHWSILLFIWKSQFFHHEISLPQFQYLIWNWKYTVIFQYSTWCSLCQIKYGRLLNLVLISVTLFQHPFSRNNQRKYLKTANPKRWHSVY